MLYSPYRAVMLVVAPMLVVINFAAFVATANPLWLIGLLSWALTTAFLVLVD